MRVAARLTDVAITTFTADLSALRALLPARVEPNEVAGPSGPGALVSAVSFVLTGVNLWPPLRCGHVDYRAYVRHRDDDAVWFLGAAMDSWLAHALRRAWGMPWHRARVEAARTEERYRLDVRSRDGDAVVRATADGAADDVRARPLVDPLVGVFGDRRTLRRYEVRHAPLTLTGARADTARIGLFERLGLVVPGQVPESVLLVDDFTIEIAFPPKRVRRP